MYRDHQTPEFTNFTIGVATDVISKALRQWPMKVEDEEVTLVGKEMKN